MYVSDYGYAVKSSDCSRKKRLDSYGNSVDGFTCAGKNWLYKGQDEWTLSRKNTNSSFVVSKGFVDTGGMLANDSNLIYGYAVRPSLYLKSDVYYVSGTGSYDDPIVIGQ